MMILARTAGYPYVDRVYGPDLMLSCCARSGALGHRHFFYGGAAGVANRLADVLAARFPGLQVAGSFSPPFRPVTEDEEGRIAALINSSRADIVWVGLGSPKQELWMARQRRLLDAPVLVGVGAAFDFHTGRIPQAPRWMMRVSLEWLFRFLHEPKRLWRRYLIGNARFVLNVLAQRAGMRRFPLG
jgi:N-acetylglucosaminyldiphosphoundecaprenol N-acetyl-beta-D-mannosaminyltransferase